MQTCYTWPEELNDTTYYKWDGKAGECLKDMVSKVISRPDNDIIDWLPTPLRTDSKLRENLTISRRGQGKTQSTSTLGLKQGLAIRVCIGLNIL